MIRTKVSRGLGLRLYLSALFAASVMLVFGQSAHAQNYPSRQITILLPFPAGTNADVVARFVADKLSSKLGVAVIVESKPGAATVPATTTVLHQPADGYTVFESGTATNINPLMGVKTPYDAERDLTPVVLVGVTPGVLVAHSSVPANTVAELIALAKKESKPLLYSSPGQGSFPHLAMEQFKQKAGISLDHVPFRGFGPAMIGLLRNDVQLSVAAIPSALPNIKAGKIKALAQMGRERMPQLPDLPTMGEAGVAGYEAAGFLGIWVRAGTPPDIVAILNREINAALTSSEIKNYAHNEGIKIMGGTPADFTAHLKSDKAIWAPVIEKGGIKAE